MQDNIEKEFENLADAREETEEMSYQYVKAKKDFAKRIQARMASLGLVKKTFDLTLIDEFQIKDMIMEDKKKWCKTCIKGLKCKIHEFQRMGKRENKLLKQHDIIMAFQPQQKKGQFS